MPIEKEFAVNGLRIAASEWGLPGDLPVLALHGWLDNAASFYRLAPLLKNVHLVAIDCAGHGKSSHRGLDVAYHIWQDVADVFAIADQLGWREFALMGHSRGGIISTLAAGTFPQRITHLALIDGFLPGITEAEEAPKQLAKSIIETQRNKSRGFALYPDKATAITVRQRSEMPVSESAAAALVERGLCEVESENGRGWTWSNDPQLKSASGMRLTSEHAQAFVDQILAPIHLVVAENGLPRIREGHQKALAKYPQVQSTSLPGTHHLHMENEAEQVAEIFNQFLV